MEWEGRGNEREGWEGEEFSNRGNPKKKRKKKKNKKIEGEEKEISYLPR